MMVKVFSLTRSIYFSLVLLTSCTAQNPWIVNSISSGDIAFDSSRMRYGATDEHTPLNLEFMKIDQEVESFLYLSRFQFSNKEKLNVKLTIEEEKIEEVSFVHEGRMRLRLPTEMTQKLIQALHDGKKVDILIDGFEKRIDPTHFGPSFAKFIGGGGLL